MLAAGRLRERIAIRRQTNTPTGNGGFNRVWKTVAGMGRIPAEVIGQSGRESFVTNTLQGVATYRITIRWRPGIRAGDQVIWTSGCNLELNILAPPSDPTGRREMLEIVADTSVRQGA